MRAGAEKAEEEGQPSVLPQPERTWSLLMIVRDSKSCALAGGVCGHGCTALPRTD